MGMPRCGLPDKEIHKVIEKRRLKRYATFDGKHFPKGEKKQLKYKSRLLVRVHDMTDY